MKKQDGETKVARAICVGGHCDCGVLVHVDNGRVMKIEGDPDHPQNEGALCVKGLAFTQLLYHPDRIKYPMKRIGKKGEGKWERISWDEALDTIASKIKEAKDEFGPESIAFQFCDGIRGNEPSGWAFMSALGSPMVCGTDAHYCFRPRAMVDRATFGSYISPEKRNGGIDVEHSKCILMWGTNPFERHMPMGKDIIKALKNDAKLIVVDPRFTNLAAKADIWLQVRPATDGALALGLLNYIIEEELYDKEFVDKYCFGFEQLRERVKEYPLKKVSEITWVTEENIRQAAMMYATLKPASLNTHMGLSMHVNAIQSIRAVHLLMALTGNIDVKGGNLLPMPNVPYFSRGAMDSKTRLSKEKMERAPGVKERPMYFGYNAFSFAPSHPPSMYEMLYTGKPYKVKVLFCVCDPVMGLQDSKRNREALKNVDFFVVADFFISPTANLADILLPAATYLEKDMVFTEHYRGFFCAREKVIAPVGECRDEVEVFIELAKRLGIELPLPMKSVKEFNNWQISPSGMTFDELKEKSVAEIPHWFIEYKKYEKEGFKFATETGKIELYSKRFEKYGYDPLPHYEEPPQSPYSTPELFEKYPLILISGARAAPFRHGAGRQIPWLRELLPDPTIEIHPETAEKLGIHDGDWVWIKTPQMEGKVKQKAEVTLGIHPKVVHARSHWWFPERTDDPDRECMESNINAILSAGEPYDPISGSTMVRGCLCKIFKVKEN
jgi:anaerobic selenocysteine-containing dehydrogenase